MLLQLNLLSLSINIFNFFKYVTTIIKMIRDYNMFTYDRLLMIMSFRSFDSFDYQLSLDILGILFTQNEDFLTKYNDYIAVCYFLNFSNRLNLNY